MTYLREETLVLPVAELNGESSLPPVAGVQNVQQQTQTELDESDELFIGYGFRSGSFPYRQQNRYAADLNEKTVKTFVLENEYLRATFLPDYGGRLRSLFDKEKHRELLFCNPVIRPRNLALRNAWLSGGVEWNCGVIGHSAYTCSPVFAAETALADGTPVLRMYEYERTRNAVYQMDFFLPQGSRWLYARMRIVNPNRETVPMYWWSNIAVEEDAHGRVVMPATETYTNRDNRVSKTTVPVSGGVDITYPTHNPVAIDFFWKLRKDARRFVTQLGQDGYGLCQTSTDRLRGRKLFVWGQGAGGTRWQQYLSGSGCAGRYVEIQAGLAHTQYECLPMPPETAWEWLEAYGPLQVAPECVHGEWANAVAATEEALEASLRRGTVEVLLEATHAMAVAPAGSLLHRGSGWGALEAQRRAAAGEKPLCPQLDFGEPQKQQQAWLSLLRTGSVGAFSLNAPPESWMEQRQWIDLLRAAVAHADRKNAYAWLLLGMAELATGALERAGASLGQSMALTPSCWARYGLAQLARLESRAAEAAALCVEAAKSAPQEDALAMEAMRLLLEDQQHREAVDFAAQCPPEVRHTPRMRLLLANALLGVGDTAGAEALLWAEGGLVVPDIREGENSVTDLWYAIEAKKAEAEGRAFDPETAVPPPQLDFRMNAQ